ncbi:colicin D domain-containing protein [Natrinema sp. 1APR25-10V2]|uniref:colicin D domain-containing protein n=1 Tax=Natrinema sp. 1APR25-10V2 TaxID=2951081 RepID=UPI002874E23D|nr:colicin D domain-containing protein [Natrinema sp. 1APR25-10V2]MDS0474450.1 VWA domain-containing protein [Natrinema sp. 1APR25-10V2]
MNQRVQKILGVAFSILLITGAIGPALAARGGNTAGTAVGDDDLNGAYQLFAAGEQDPAALELKYAAVAEFAAIQPADKRDERLKKRVGERLNETLDLYLDTDRVESHMVFEGDAAAVSRMAPLADADPAAVNESTWLLAKANARTANVSITDTRRALKRFEDDIDNPGHRNAIESHIRNAERAYDRGERALEDDGGSNVERTARDRARAIRQFMTAWRQSQQALDKLERQTTPRVRITTRNDPVRNGSEATNRTIGGAIEAVRPDELGNVTVTVEGGSTIEVQPSTSTVPASNVTFVANVSFEDRDQRIRATLADSTNGKYRRGPPKHAKGRHSDGDISPITDELLLDGDALPDTYELETAGTDPLDHDSDSSRTAVDESDNETIDGLEDFDGDTVTTYHEGLFGTDPFNGDTDGDRLPDRYEITYSKLDQTKADTNDDGVTDDAWDIDNDSLTTLEEYEAGTTPTLADEDRDDLDDDRELEVGTNSNDPDTDDDGLLDGEELELGTDPLVADSDGDDVLDGNATYTTETSNESLGVNVSLSGNGEIASGVSIRNGSQERFESDSIESAQVTSFVNLESERSFDSANVTFSYDDSRLGETNESDLVVFRYNESLGMFEPLNTTVDAESNTVTGETEHFSRFVVFDVRNWASNFVAKRPEDGTDRSEVQPVDVTMIIDSSGSMGWNDPQEFRKQAAKEFVGALVEEDRAGVIDFDHNAHVAQELTTDFGQVNLTIESLDASGGTNIGAGVRKANQHFAEASNDSRAQFAILLTDGQGSGGRAEARTAARRNTTIYTIGFGGANGNKLRDIAQITGGNYTYVDNPSDLPNVFSRVADDIGAQDTDGDGISDTAEHRGVVTARAGIIETDPYSADTDGDGLEDGTELGEAITAEELRDRNSDGSGPPGPDPQYLAIVNTLSSAGYNTSEFSGSIYIDPVSDPTRVHTDGDGVDDYTELREPVTYARTTSREATKSVLETGEATEETFEDAYDTDQATSDPWDSDTDYDDLDDGRERELATNPDDGDTDGDGIRDGDETSGRNDPTLYDVHPPKLDVNTETSGWRVPETSLDATYWAYASIEDEAGIEEVAFVKEGSVEKRFDVSDDELNRQFEYTDRISEGNVDTSSVQSTIVSGVGSAIDLGGDITGAIGDVTLGTSVYLRATDANGNRQQTIAVQRENFYGYMAGELPTGWDLADREIARKLGTVSGFSASIGVVFRDAEQLLQDPGAFIDGMRAMLELVAEADPAVVDRLIDGYIQQFEQKQEQNNPYEEGTTKYRLFEENWYEGYALGFLSKLVVSGGSTGAKNAIKSTDRVGDIADRLSDSRALRALSRIDGPTDAAKARVTARLLLATDDAAEPLLSQGETAGQVFRLWRLQRGMDADVDALPETRQQQLGRLLSRTGGDGQRAFDDLAGLDSGATDRLLEIENPITQRHLVKAYQDSDVDANDLSQALESYGDLDADGKQVADTILAEGGNGGISLLAKQVCSSPCRSFAEAVDELASTNSVDEDTARELAVKLSRKTSSGALTDERAATLLGDVKKVADEDDVDVTATLMRDGDLSRTLITEYGKSDVLDERSLRRAHRLGEVYLPDSQVQSKFKHADDFGVEGNWNTQNKRRYKDALSEHILNPDTEIIEGTYRGRSVKHIYNSGTGNNVMLNSDGEFVSGWKLSKKQRQHLEETGDL